MKIKPTELTKLREYFDTNGISYEVAYWEDNRYNLHVNSEYVKILDTYISAGRVPKYII